MGDSSQGQKTAAGGPGLLDLSPLWGAITAAPRQRGLIGGRASKLPGIPPRGWQSWGDRLGGQGQGVTLGNQTNISQLSLSSGKQGRK